jgi:hypothetical protein
MGKQLRTSQRIHTGLRGRAYFRPKLETLEERLVLNTYMWTPQSNSTDWASPSNWTESPTDPFKRPAPPVAGDTAVFDGGSQSNLPCSLPTGTTTIAVLQIKQGYTQTITVGTGNTLVIDPGGPSVSGGYQSDPLSNLSGGTIEIKSGYFDWRAGKQTGAQATDSLTVDPNAQLYIDQPTGTATLVLDKRELDVKGTVLWQYFDPTSGGSGQLQLNNGASIVTYTNSSTSQGKFVASIPNVLALTGTQSTSPIQNDGIFQVNNTTLNTTCEIGHGWNGDDTQSQLITNTVNGVLDLGMGSGTVQVDGNITTAGTVNFGGVDVTVDALGKKTFAIFQTSGTVQVAVGNGTFKLGPSPYMTYDQMFATPSRFRSSTYTPSTFIVETGTAHIGTFQQSTGCTLDIEHGTMVAGTVNLSGTANVMQSDAVLSALTNVNVNNFGYLDVFQGGTMNGALLVNASASANIGAGGDGNATINGDITIYGRLNNDSLINKDKPTNVRSVTVVRGGIFTQSGEAWAKFLLTDQATANLGVTFPMTGTVGGTINGTFTCDPGSTVNCNRVTINGTFTANPLNQATGASLNFPQGGGMTVNGDVTVNGGIMDFTGTTMSGIGMGVNAGYQGTLNNPTLKFTPPPNWANGWPLFIGSQAKSPPANPYSTAGGSIGAFQLPPGVSLSWEDESGDAPAPEGVVVYAGLHDPDYGATGDGNAPVILHPKRSPTIVPSLMIPAAVTSPTTAVPSVGAVESLLPPQEASDANAGQRYHAAGLDVAGGANRQASSATRVLAGALRSSHVEDAFFAQNDNTGLSW